ncbi:MAG: sigma-70 family RNA polymerase sigma factor [Verrucomicrobiae bacterium]|nr:sigma-70 family RNA polymerase sigma factor [Verrucomicrobiae bacterium]
MDRSADQTAFVAALTDAQLPLRLYVQSLLPGDFAAADVVQQANTTAWGKREDFEPGTNFKAWIFAIARYEVLNYRKRQARDARLVFSDEVEQLFAEDLATRDELTERRHEALRGCLSKLRPQDRDLLMHRYDADAGTLDEFADRVGRSVGGLKVTLHRLRNTLLACIEKQLSPARATP